MFQLSKEELEDWRSQFVTSNKDKMGLRRQPYAFTELGVAMLSSVLNSDRAIQMNIRIMETFVKLREMTILNKELKLAIEQVDKKMIMQDIKNEKYDNQIKVIFEYIQKLMILEEKPKRKIGFHNIKNKLNAPG